MKSLQRDCREHGHRFLVSSRKTWRAAAWTDCFITHFEEWKVWDYAG